MDQVRATSAAPSTGPHETPSAVEGNDATAPSSSASASGDMPEALAGLSISEDVSAEGMDYPPQLPSLDDPCLSHDSTLVDGGGQVRTSTIDWTEEFPPLGDPKGERKLDTCGVWGEKKHQLLESEKQEEADGSVTLCSGPSPILILLTTAYNHLVGDSGLLSSPYLSTPPLESSPKCRVRRKIVTRTFFRIRTVGRSCLCLPRQGSACPP